MSDSKKFSTLKALFSLLSLSIGLLAGGCTAPLADPGDGGSDGQGGGDQDCAVLCAGSEECCPGESCVAGICQGSDQCLSGCNWECDKAAGQICDRATHRCVPGVPAINCISDCDCFANEACDAGICVEVADPGACQTDADCLAGEQCLEHKCQPGVCEDREDCVGDGNCLICKDGQCTTPPAVCRGDQDCCVGSYCNFGTCTILGDECLADSDCTDPDQPRCMAGNCVEEGVECLADIDCPLAGQQCLDGRCVGGDCTPETCAQGQWCDTAAGICRPGCDSNTDCLPPETCNYQSHACGPVDCCNNACADGSQVCDPITCQCVAVCQSDGDCPATYQCRPADGQCVCTAAACLAGTHCDAASGACLADGPYCDPNVFSSPIACADALSGSWTGDCPSSVRDDSYARQYTFAGQAGSFVTIDLVSATDPYLYLIDPSGAVEAYDDDGGGGNDARISKPLEATGTYVIEATTSYAQETGNFEVSLGCANPGDCTAPIACGQSIDASWTGQCPSSERWDAYARQYTFVGQARQPVTIDLTSSVDTYLYLIAPDGRVEEYDDDGGPGSNSQITRLLDMDGTYTIEATTYDSYETGAFSLGLQCGEAVVCAEAIACGATASGMWTDDCVSDEMYGSYARWYTFPGQAGHSVTIEIDSSRDSFLILYDPDGDMEDYDDDSGAGSDARISKVLRETGTYTIEATTYYGWTSGSFDLDLTCNW